MSDDDRSIVIAPGARVKMEYLLSVDGEVLDSSNGKQPLDFIEGQGKLVPGLEKAVLGLKRWDRRHIAVPPEEAYGPRREEGIQTVPASFFKEPNSLRVGGLVQGEAQGQPFRGRVVEIKSDTITLDLNHPLAGKTLEFDIEVVSVEPAGAV